MIYHQEEDANKNNEYILNIEKSDLKRAESPCNARVFGQFVVDHLNPKANSLVVGAYGFAVEVKL